MWVERERERKRGEDLGQLEDMFLPVNNPQSSVRLPATDVPRVEPSFII